MDWIVFFKVLGSFYVVLYGILFILSLFVMCAGGKIELKLKFSALDFIFAVLAISTALSIACS